MSFNFNINPDVKGSTYETRLKVARTLLAPTIERLAAGKHIFGASAATNIPDVVVGSPLLRNLSVDYRGNNVSGLAVLRTKGGMGKTVAARVLLNYAHRGIMFHGATTVNLQYWRNVAQSLGLPVDLPPTDSAWIQVLVETVANGYEDIEELNFLEKLIRGCSTDTTAPEPQPRRELERLEGVVFNKAVPRAVLIFDDFNSATEEDLEFLTAIYRAARDIEGIYCFVTTQDAAIANKLIDKNAWLKLNPLPGCYESDVDPNVDDVPQETGHYPHPTWKVEWSKDELVQLVIARYDERMLSFVQITARMAPTAVVKLCNESIDEWKADSDLRNK